MSAADDATGAAADLGTDRWRLPDGVDQLLPDASRRVEALRRGFIDLGARWGFEPVTPPLIDYLDGLLTGTGEVLDLQTFKLVDHVDGRALGVRADMTPQVARIDAHALDRSGPSRLLYTGTVLRARTDAVGGSRNPQQFGAELFGHAGPHSDLEVCRLMLEAVLLSELPASALTLSVGHVGIFAGLVAASGLPESAVSRLFDAMVRGSVPDVEAVLAEPGAVASPRAVQALRQLPSLRGDSTAVDDAEAVLGGLDARADAALVWVRRLLAGLQESHPEVRVHVDLAELRGYRYHTGLLFAVHDPAGQTLARGGRYDAIGQAFGAARPATGFSGELATLARHRPVQPALEDAVVLLDPDAEGAWAAAQALREQGECVTWTLPGTPPDPRPGRELVRSAAGWTVRERSR